jgi:hypothetical protein
MNICAPGRLQSQSYCAPRCHGSGRRVLGFKSTKGLVTGRLWVQECCARIDMEGSGDASSEEVLGDLADIDGMMIKLKSRLGDGRACGSLRTARLAPMLHPMLITYTLTVSGSGRISFLKDLNFLFNFFKISAAKFCLVKVILLFVKFNFPLISSFPLKF